MDVRQVHVFSLSVVLNWLLSQCYATHMVDLTHDLGFSTIYWPGNVDFNMTTIFRGQTEHFWYESNWFGTPEHGGTHLDAPAHFGKGKWHTHQIPASRLIGPGVVIDVTSQTAKNPDYRVRVSDLSAWEEKHGRIPNGAIVMMHSDWGVRYPNKTLVFNTNEPDNSSTFHFPGFHEDAATWLATERNISIIGVDTPSVDYGQSVLFLAHQVVCGHNIPGLENLANLQQLPPKGFTVFVGVVKLVDGSGGPARILALIDDDPQTNQGCVFGGFLNALIVGLLLCVAQA